MPSLPNARVLSPCSPEWPRVLADLAKPPSELAIAGELPDLSKAVAVVGTRRPDPGSRSFTRDLARELAAAGYTIVSGGALGVDTEAHLGALEAGGRTVAVLATGLARPYPAQNHSLFAQIAHRGALLSEALEPTPGWPSAFLDRNRIIAALAPVVVVVQAPLRSGALSTAAHARQLGRQLLVVPHAPWAARGAGCLTLLAAGARVCRSSTDVLSLAAPKGQKLPSPHSGTRKKVYENPDLDEDERAVVGALDEGPLAIDELCESTGLSAPRVQRAILMLLLSSVIQEVGCGRYARRDCL